MGKWLAGAGIALIVLLLILWRQLDDADTAASTRAEKPQITSPSAIASLPDSEAPKPKQKASTAVDPSAKQTDATEKKVLDPGSDLFYKNFLDIIPKRLWKDAAICYEGKVGTRDRDAKYKLAFNVLVRNGKVTVRDVHVANDEDGKPVNTIHDPAIESCFFQHVARYQWNGNDDMPDGYSIPDYEYPDELVIRPERSKKYYKDNMEYVGAEAPRDP